MDKALKTKNRVGWVEARNPTNTGLVDVGFHFVQPNLQLFFTEPEVYSATRGNMSQEKIEKLTPEQETLIPVYREKWRKIALSTEPIDREKAKEAVKAAYKLIGLAEPKIIFFDSPYLASIGLKYDALNYCDHLYDDNLLPQLRHRLGIKSPTLLKEKLDMQLLEQLQLIQRLLSHEMLNKLYYLPEEFEPGSMQPDNLCFEISWLDFCISELKCEHDTTAVEIYQAILRYCGWICAYQEHCFVCDRPRILSFDNEYRLHAEGAPAIQFADGYSLYAYHGVTLPEKYGKLHPKQWQPQWLLEEDNAELRRVLIQGIGYDRIAHELAAIELDSYQEYTLLKIDNNVDVEPIYLLKMTCPSTGFIHALRVPPDIESAREAIRWVNWGIDPEEFAIQT